MYDKSNLHLNYNDNKNINKTAIVQTVRQVCLLL